MSSYTHIFINSLGHIKDWLSAVLKDNEAFHLSILEHLKQLWHSVTLILRGYFNCVA